MFYKQEATVRSLPSFVWPYLISVEKLPLWNSRIRRIFPLAPGPFCRNFRFEVILLVNGEEHEYTGEVTEIVEHRRIVFKLRSKTDTTIPVSTEIITLTPAIKGTKICRETEVFTKEKVVSWWVKLLRKFFRFGQKKKEDNSDQSLKRLAQLIEKNRQRLSS